VLAGVSFSESYAGTGSAVDDPDQAFRLLCSRSADFAHATFPPAATSVRVNFSQPLDGGRDGGWRVACQTISPSGRALSLSAVRAAALVLRPGPGSASASSRRRLNVPGGAGAGTVGTASLALMAPHVVTGTAHSAVLSVTFSPPPSVIFAFRPATRIRIDGSASVYDSAVPAGLLSPLWRRSAVGLATYFFGLSAPNSSVLAALVGAASTDRLSIVFKGVDYDSDSASTDVLAHSQWLYGNATSSVYGLSGGLGGSVDATGMAGTLEPELALALLPESASTIPAPAPVNATVFVRAGSLSFFTLLLDSLSDRGGGGASTSFPCELLFSISGYPAGVLTGSTALGGVAGRTFDVGGNGTAGLRCVWVHGGRVDVTITSASPILPSLAPSLGAALTLHIKPSVVRAACPEPASGESLSVAGASSQTGAGEKTAAGGLGGGCPTWPAHRRPFYDPQSAPGGIPLALARGGLSGGTGGGLLGHSGLQRPPPGAVAAPFGAGVSVAEANLPPTSLYVPALVLPSVQLSLPTMIGACDTQLVLDLTLSSGGLGHPFKSVYIRVQPSTRSSSDASDESALSSNELAISTHLSNKYGVSGSVGIDRDPSSFMVALDPTKAFGRHGASVSVAELADALPWLPRSLFLESLSNRYAISVRMCNVLDVCGDLVTSVLVASSAIGGAGGVVVPLQILSSSSLDSGVSAASGIELQAVGLDAFCGSSTLSALSTPVDRFHAAQWVLRWEVRMNGALVPALSYTVGETDGLSSSVASASGSSDPTATGADGGKCRFFNMYCLQGGTLLPNREYEFSVSAFLAQASGNLEFVSGAASTRVVVRYAPLQAVITATAPAVATGATPSASAAAAEAATAAPDAGAARMGGGGEITSALEIGTDAIGREYGFSAVNSLDPNSLVSSVSVPVGSYLHYEWNCDVYSTVLRGVITGDCTTFAAFSPPLATQPDTPAAAPAAIAEILTIRPHTPLPSASLRLRLRLTVSQVRSSYARGSLPASDSEYTLGGSAVSSGNGSFFAPGDSAFRFLRLLPSLGSTATAARQTYLPEGTTNAPHTRAVLSLLGGRGGAGGLDPHSHVRLRGAVSGLVEDSAGQAGLTGPLSLAWRVAAGDSEAESVTGNSRLRPLTAVSGLAVPSQSSLEARLVAAGASAAAAAAGAHSALLLGGAARLELPALVLVPSTQYTFTLAVTGPTGVVHASASCVLTTANAGPIPGSLRVFPTFGYAMSTEFRLSAVDWSADELPMSFEYSLTLPPAAPPSGLPGAPGTDADADADADAGAAGGHWSPGSASVATGLLLQHRSLQTRTLVLLPAGALAVPAPATASAAISFTASAGAADPNSAWHPLSASASTSASNSRRYQPVAVSVWDGMGALGAEQAFASPQVAPPISGVTLSPYALTPSALADSAAVSAQATRAISSESAAFLHQQLSSHAFEWGRADCAHAPTPVQCAALFRHACGLQDTHRPVAPPTANNPFSTAASSTAAEGLHGGASLGVYPLFSPSHSCGGCLDGYVGSGGGSSHGGGGGTDACAPYKRVATGLTGPKLVSPSADDPWKLEVSREMGGSVCSASTDCVDLHGPFFECVSVTLARCVGMFWKANLFDV
jgi:hypothetical protein